MRNSVCEGIAFVEDKVGMLVNSEQSKITSELQELNALLLIFVTPCGITTDERDWQDENALLPMLVTPCGITTDERDWQDENK